jgi:lysophospholipase L1-like esterase
MTLALFIVIVAGIGALLIALAVQQRYRRAQSVARGLIISYAVFVLALAAGEAYLRWGYAESRMEFGLHGQNWANKYIERNSLGFRDREWTAAELDARTSIFVLGDSFTEGWGLNSPADRYTDVLQNLLGDDYAVVEIAKAGQATYHQTENLESHPYQTPDVVIWQYFLNDIEVAAKSNGMQWDFDVPSAAPIVNESYLASFIYWRTNYEKLFRNIHDGRTEWEFYYAAYDNPYIWDIHRQEIERLIDAIEARGARLIVVIFPNMLDPVGSIPYVDRVAQAFEARGITEILKLTDEAAAWGLPERIVSNVDSHASVAFNRRVGQLLYEQFFAPE